MKYFKVKFLNSLSIQYRMTSLILAFMLLSCTSIVYGKEINLTIYGARNSAYFNDLLKESLEKQSFRPTIKKLSEKYNQKRLMAMLEKDELISLMWRGQSPKYDKKFEFVEASLTLGLKAMSLS